MHGKIINEREHYALLSTGGAASFFSFFMEDLGIPILEKLWRHDKGSAPRFFSFTDCCLAHARKYLLYNNFLQQN